MYKSRGDATTAIDQLIEQVEKDPRERAEKDYWDSVMAFSPIIEAYEKKRDVAFVEAIQRSDLTSAEATILLLESRKITQRIRANYAPNANPGKF